MASTRAEMVIWDGYRSTTVRALGVAQHNSYAPGFLDLGDEEIGKFCKPEVGDKRVVCLAQSGSAPGRVQSSSPVEAL